MTQPPPPTEVKKSNPWRNLSIALLVILIAGGTGVAIWLMKNPPRFSGYTQIKVIKGNTVTHEFGGTTYYFSYGPYYAYQQTSLYVAPNFYSIPSFLDNPTKGSRYEVLGLEIIVSEIYADYVVLMVKPL